MARAETLAAVREKYPQYKDMSDDALGSALAAKYPQYADLAPAPSAPKAEPEGALHHVGRIVKEEAAKVPGRVREDIAGIAETVAHPKMTTLLPLTLGPGAGVASRLGALGAGAMVDQPSTNPSENLATATKAVAAGAVPELAAGALPKVKIPLVGKLADLAENAARNPKAAFDSIAARLPNARILVPSLDPAAKLSFAEVGARIAKLSGDARKQAIAEVRTILDGIDKQLLAGGPRPGAGELFAERAGTHPVTGFEGVAKAVVPALSTSKESLGPAVRTAADIAAQEDVGGIPAGLIPPAAVMSGGEGFGRLARHLIHLP